MNSCFRWAVSAIVICGVFLLHAQALDWDTDRIVYGLNSSEHHPVITSINGILQVSCDTGDGRIVTRFSSNNGLTWDAFSEIRPAGHGTRLSNCNDGENSYLSVFTPGSSELWIYRFDTTQLLADSHMIFLGSAHEQPSIAIATDYLFDPEEPFLNLVWQEYYWSSGRTQGMFGQSRDRGQSFSDTEIVFEVVNDSPLRSNIATSVTWSGETEKIWVCAAVDRMGSVGEEVVLYSSNGAGGEWQAVRVDSSAYTQEDLSVAGHESTLLAAYARRVNAASQKEIFFTYTLNNGEEFASSMPLTSSNSDDYAPQIVICPELNRFSVFFLSSEVQQEPATLWVSEGDLAAPWLLSEPVRVSESDQAMRSGGYDACATPDGFAAVWTGPGILGDSEIWFDSSWEGESANEEHSLPTSRKLGLPYPNPFNSTVTVPFQLNHEMNITLSIHNSLGREVRRKSFGKLSAGSQELVVDFTGLSTGAYFIEINEIPRQALSVSFIK